MSPPARVSVARGALCGVRGCPTSRHVLSSTSERLFGDGPDDRRPRALKVLQQRAVCAGPVDLEKGSQRCCRKVWVGPPERQLAQDSAGSGLASLAEDLGGNHALIHNGVAERPQKHLDVVGTRWRADVLVALNACPGGGGVFCIAVPAVMGRAHGTGTGIAASSMDGRARAGRLLIIEANPLQAKRPRRHSV